MDNQESWVNCRLYLTDIMIPHQSITLMLLVNVFAQKGFVSEFHVTFITGELTGALLSQEVTLKLLWPMAVLSTVGTQQREAPCNKVLQNQTLVYKFRVNTLCIPLPFSCDDTN